MSQKDRPGVLREHALLLLCLAVLIPVEILCARAAFETIGEITSWQYWALVIVSNSLVLLVAIASRKVALALALLLGLAIVPYQLLLMRRHSLVRAEAARIVTYAYETKASTGAYPAGLDGYAFERPEVRKYIQGYYVGEQYGGFQVMYRVGTETTSHWYSPNGGWDYYPD